MSGFDVDIAVIGGGAAGLAAAIFARQAGAHPGASVAVLDGAAKLGAKILVSGGGRCNVTHDVVRPEDFQGPRKLIKRVLRAFDERAAAAWFESLGVRLKREETGKLFPVSDDAHTVLGALVGRCEALGVRLMTGHRVREIRRLAEGGFEMGHSRGVMTARRVVLATGGRSLPKTGSDGGGYALAKRLGHTVTATYPALAPLVLEGPMFHASLAGVSHEAEFLTFAEGKRVDQRVGSLLWTHFGVSGPVAMDASRFWTTARGEGKQARMMCSFLPGEDFERVERWLIDVATDGPRRGLINVLGERLPRRVAEVIAGHVGLEAGVAMGQLPREARRTLVHALTGLDLRVARDRGWNYAEVTAGGVPLEEVDPGTMGSRVAEGLYLVGEVLDCDGRIGGFNFQWAWSTGFVAGTAAGKS